MYNPFTEYRITQGFSSKHQAIDYGMNVGTPLPSPSDGVVTYQKFSDAGYTATITRSDGSWTRYAHGKSWGLFTPRPHQVKQGELVKMRSGNSGISTGPHLHAFDVAADGTRQPPFTTGPSFAGGDGTPIIEEQDMAQGAFYRNKTSGAIFWQEMPNTPLIPVDLPTWVAYAANGNKYADLEAQDVNALIGKWGQIPAPATGGAGGDPDQIAQAVDAALADDFTAVRADVNKPRTLQ